jgi:cAMP-dependent protein kinase regulator
MMGFGEIALLYNVKRTATVRAVKDCVCWVIEGMVFKSIIIKQAFKRRTIDPSFVEKVDIFASMEKYERVKLLGMLAMKTLKKGDYVFREGDAGDNFYMIAEGEVECIKIQAAPNVPSEPAGAAEEKKEVHVRDLKTGEHFGELALLTPGGGGKRSLSVRVKSEVCELVFLDRKDFAKIVGDISNYLKMNYGGEFDSKYQQTPAFLARQ